MRSVVIWRYGNKSRAERASERAMNSVYDAYFPGLATSAIRYFIIVATSRLQSGVCTRAYIHVEEISAIETERRIAETGCVLSTEKWDGILSS